MNTEYRLGEILTDGHGDKWLKIVEGSTNNKIQYLSLQAVVSLIEALKLDTTNAPYFSRED